MKRLCLTALIPLVLSCASANVAKIENYEHPQKALLVIDMQIDYVGENARLSIEKKQISNLIVTVNNIIDEYSKNNCLIIYTRRVFKKNDFRNRRNNYAAVEGTPGVDIDPGIKIVSDNIFDKFAADSFTNTDFENFLVQNQVNEIFVCGVMADQCVYETALRAFDRGYIVNYFENAVGSISDRNISNAVKKLKKKGINIITY